MAEYFENKFGQPEDKRQRVTLKRRNLLINQHYHLSHSRHEKSEKLLFG
jgi:hypothetical protein